jgi:hypothetical protein
MPKPKRLRGEERGGGLWRGSSGYLLLDLRKESVLIVAEMVLRAMGWTSFA